MKQSINHFWKTLKLQSLFFLEKFGKVQNIQKLNTELLDTATLNAAALNTAALVVPLRKAIKTPKI